MKDSFPGYYRPSQDEFRELWHTACIALDANVLLSLYRYSRDNARELLDVLEGLSDRLWLPHQAALEYHENRADVILSEQSQCQDRMKDLTEAYEALRGGLDNHLRPPSDELTVLIQDIGTRIEPLEEGVTDYAAPLDLDAEDHIRDRLTELLQGKVGDAYPPERLVELHREGETRYERSVPPGYQDRNKGDERQFGDWVMWRQLLDRGDESNGIIFVSEDRKEDWWLVKKGRTLGPRPELVAEMSCSFYMYRTNQFLTRAAAIVGEEPGEGLLAQAEILSRQKTQEARALRERAVYFHDTWPETERPTAVAINRFDQMRHQLSMLERELEYLVEKRNRLAHGQHAEGAEGRPTDPDEWHEVQTEISLLDAEREELRWRLARHSIGRERIMDSPPVYPDYPGSTEDIDRRR